MTLAITAAVSRYFGTVGILKAIVHGIWLPRHGVSGFTAEPREKCYALRGWPPSDARHR